MWRGHGDERGIRQRRGVAWVVSASEKVCWLGESTAMEKANHVLHLSCSCVSMSTARTGIQVAKGQHFSTDGSLPSTSIDNGSIGRPLGDRCRAARARRVPRRTLYCRRSCRYRRPGPAPLWQRGPAPTCLTDARLPKAQCGINVQPRVWRVKLA